MLIPKKVKHRKWQRGRRRNKGVATNKTNVDFGSFGLKSQSHAWLTSRQIEAARRAITRHIKRGGKLWIRVFPDKPVTQKGNEMPMGKGKGTVDHYVVVIKPGMVLFELDGVDKVIASRAFDLASYKLPVKTVFVEKNVIRI